jgi:drug/metabolite transporter (DMT)-like permease
MLLWHVIPYKDITESLCDVLVGDNVNANYNLASVEGQSNIGLILLMRLKADLTLLLVSIIWGSAFVAQRVAGQMGSVYLFNGARYLLAALVVLPLMIGARRRMNPYYRTPREQYQWMFIAGFLLFIGSAFQQAGMVYTTAGNAGFISGLYVVLVPFALFIVWKDKPHWLSIVAVILAGVGAFLLSTGGRFEVRAGDVLELVGALFWTFHVIVLGKYASKFEALSFSVGQLIVCSVLNLSVGIFTEPIIAFNWPLVLGIIYTAFFALGLCYTLQIWAQRHTPPADAALILSLESVFAVISGWLILDEKLVLIQILGCVLIFIAVLLSQFKEWTSGKMDHAHLLEGR